MNFGADPFYSFCIINAFSYYVISIFLIDIYRFDHKWYAVRILNAEALSYWLRLLYCDVIYTWLVIRPALWNFALDSSIYWWTYRAFAWS